MTNETIGTAATVVDKPRRSPQRSSSRWIWVAVGLAIATLVAALALAIARNIVLQEKLANCRTFAAKCVTETNEMARQCGLAARVSLEKSSDQEATTADDSTEEDAPMDGGIDGSEPRPAEKW